jgi:hypothetical protein
MNGCNGELNCVLACAQGDAACVTACQQNATATANSDLNALYNCVFGACASATSTDPCSTANPNYATTCAQCQQNALGSTCSIQYSTCTSNTP